MNKSLNIEKLGNVLNGNYTIRFDENTEEEDRILFKTLNTLLDRLEEQERVAKRSQTVISKSPIPMLIFDSNFNVTDANPAFFSQTGYTRDYLIGTNASSFKLTNVEGDSFRQVKETKKTGSARMNFEIPLGVKIYERHLIPYLDEEGKTRGYFGIYFDITEVESQKQKAEKLRLLSNYYENNLNSAITTLNSVSAGEINTQIKKPKADENFPNASEYFTALYAGIENIRRDYEVIPDIADLMARVATNDYTKKLTGNYTGGLKDIADSANMMVDHMVLIQETVEDLAVGDLSKLEIFRKIKKESENDRIVPGFTRLMENLIVIVDEAEYLSNAAKTGNLSAQADMNKFSGEYRRIVESFVELARALLIPLNEARRMADGLSKGDYTTRFNENIHVENDLLDFKNELNAIATEGTEMIKKIKTISTNVNSSSVEVATGAGEISKAVEQVALNSQQGANLTNKLLSEIEGVSRQIADFSAANEEIAGSSQHVLAGALEVVKNGEEAQELGKNTTGSMASVKDITAKSVEEIDELNIQMQEINNIVKLITEITNQINLLALNAAIEAARAGEHGRGFAVVAGEVKNLAVEARSATNHIDEVIERVKLSSQNTAKAISSAHNEVNKSVEDVEKTIDALNRIVEGTNAATEAIGEITKTLEDQANIATNVVQAADAGTELTMQVQSQAEELAALAEEASSSTEEITSAIHEVSMMTKELEDSTNAFKIEG
ncbi:PAS domain S-box protein [Methanoplanus sp. FWC-SCC4]|uniref:PAS domain S-box protein n=1 Tax=Methanochimaera problematica TaxID=2609417 RepID=A0AA97FCN6_9EURY|nr:methyl-accepting chemotaxis protein [Methanoplanus sp. FWC-SCC4]WOF16612.1 PAS domain S-box protein [Methanoplanus sp. FWC-SCC4]